MDLLTKKIKEIKMSDDMRKRIMKKCYDKMNHNIMMKNELKRDIRTNDKMEKEMEKTKMNRKSKNKYVKHPMTAAAALVLCVCITGVTAMAAAGKLEGFFKDIKRWDGAVVGTAYEQATEEITVSIEMATDEELDILVIIEEPAKPPYSESELFGIASYKIEDMSGNIVLSEEAFGERVSFNNQMFLEIPLNQIPSGEYKLVIEQFMSEKKADQPLRISGNWECEFKY